MLREQDLKRLVILAYKKEICDKNGINERKQYAKLLTENAIKFLLEKGYKISFCPNSYCKYKVEA